MVTGLTAGMNRQKIILSAYGVRSWTMNVTAVATGIYQQ
jgi:hypothetical protein